MGTQKRERQKAARRARVEAEQRAAQRSSARRRIVVFGGLGIIAAVVLFLLTSDGGGDEVESTGDTTAATITDDTSSGDTSTGDGTPAEFVYGTGECAPEDGTDERRTEFTDAPPLCIDPTATYTAAIETTMGTFEVVLDAQAAPGTVNNFVNLARWNYYDGILFHRVIDDFVIQAGDPQPEPDGSGGPGYQFADELPASVSEYVEGSLAMANAGPGTNGSQFFVWFGPNPLPGPNYSLFGRVTADTLDVARSILVAETDERDRPVTDVVINDVTITVSGGEGGEVAGEQ